LHPVKQDLQLRKLLAAAKKQHEGSCKKFSIHGLIFLLRRMIMLYFIHEISGWFS